MIAFFSIATGDVLSHVATIQQPGTAAKPGIPDYLTVAEIAAKIKATRAFVYKEIDAGHLEADRFGTLVRVTPEQFDRYRSRQPKQPPQAA